MTYPPEYLARTGFEGGEENAPPPDNQVNHQNVPFERSDVNIHEPTNQHSPERAGEPFISEDDTTHKYEKKFRYYILMLENPDSSRRWKAAESLARLGDDRAVDPLVRALSDEDWRVRQKVAWALGYLGDPKAIPALRKAYRHDLEGVREMIAEAISMITMRMQD